GARCLLSKVLASEWAARGVTVNTVSPTVVLTDLGRKVWEGPKGDALKAQIPTGRFARPEETAATVLFLASGLLGPGQRCRPPGRRRLHHPLSSGRPRERLRGARTAVEP